MDDLTKQRRAKRAAEIAKEVDPQAGGFFMRMLERAALLGLEEADKNKKEAPEPEGPAPVQ